jgi:histidinol-phosphate aminotransferase
MHLSRRSFVKTASVGSVGALSIPLIGARGSEALREFEGLELAKKMGEFASEERARFRRRYNAADPIQLDSNENPNGPGKAALASVTSWFNQTMRYPDVQVDSVREAIAKKFGIKNENVLMSCGSGEILKVASYAFTGPGRALVTGLPSFEDPVRHTQFVKGEVRAVPVDGNLKLDLGRMLDQVNETAGLVFLCNPNNPTATVHGKAAIAEFIAGVNRKAPNCYIMLDEAYHEYVEDPTYETGIQTAINNPRVFVVRTFSKVFGMAGMRLGYAIGQPELLQQMAPHRLPNAINILACAAGVATIQDAKHIEDEVKLNKAARAYTLKQFETMGYKASASNGNFLMVAINRDIRGFREACAKQGILVGRPFPPLLTHARISIGTMAEMEKATAVFKTVLSSSAD